MTTALIFRVLSLAGAAIALGCLLAGDLLVAIGVGLCAYAMTVISDAEEARTKT